MRLKLLRIIVIGLGSAPSAAQAQAMVAGRVLEDSTRVALAGIEVTVPRQNLRVITDSLGAFTFRNLQPGTILLVARGVGFTPDTIDLELEIDESLSTVIVLRRSIASLQTVDVIDSGPRVSAKLAAYENRKQRIPNGKFLDRAEIEKWEARRTGDILSMVAGIEIIRLAGAAYAVGSRASIPLTMRTTRDPCWMDVYVDGALTYSKSLPSALRFDLNAISLTAVAAIEVYTSAANMPPEFNRTSKGCGVLVIWTR